MVEYSAKEEPVDCGHGAFNCTKQDASCAALGDLYYGTRFSSWLIRDGWDKAAAGIPIDYCSFFVTEGTLCNAAGAITQLTLYSNGAVRRALRRSFCASLTPGGRQA